MKPEEEKIVFDIVARFAPDCDVFAFGSRFRGTNRETSDLDLAFALPDSVKLPLERLDEIKYAFSESDLLFRVDVLDYNGVEQYFREIINRECLKIYGSSDGDDRRSVSVSVEPARETVSEMERST